MSRKSARFLAVAKNHKEIGQRSPKERLCCLDTALPLKGYRGQYWLVTRPEEDLIPIEKRLGKKHREKGAQHEKWAEGDIVVTFHNA